MQVVGLSGQHWGQLALDAGFRVHGPVFDQDSSSSSSYSSHSQQQQRRRRRRRRLRFFQHGLEDGKIYWEEDDWSLLLRQGGRTVVLPTFRHHDKPCGAVEVPTEGSLLNCLV